MTCKQKTKKNLVKNSSISPTHLDGRFITMHVVDMQPAFPFTRMRTTANFANEKQMILRPITIAVDIRSVSTSRGVSQRNYLFGL